MQCSTRQARLPWSCGVRQNASVSVTRKCSVLPSQRSSVVSNAKGAQRRCSTSAVSDKVYPMMHPPGPGILHPECKDALDLFWQDIREQDEQARMEGIAAGFASGLPDEIDETDNIEAVIETPPEWGAPDEGNPNQPRRPPEYQPPQEPLPGGPSTPEFDPPERTRPSPPVPEDDPMRPLPPQQPEIPPNERDPLKKAPEQMPGQQPARRGDEQTQPQPGEASASTAASGEEEAVKLSAEQAELLYLQWCRDTYGIEGLVEVYLGANDQPMVELTHPSGSTAQVYLQGGNIASWTSPVGTELLHLKSQEPGLAPEGGVSVSFPNFGHHHRLPTHGFLQHAHWSIIDSSQSGPLGWDPAPQITLFAESDEQTLKAWPHHFQAAYSIQLMVPDDLPEIDMPNNYERPQPKEAFGSALTSPLGNDEMEEQPQQTMQLKLQLQVQNTGEEDMTFTTGMRSHLATEDLTKHANFVKILGLGGKHFLSFARNPLQPTLGLEEEDYVTFGEHNVNRIYTDSDEGQTKFCPGNQTHFEVLQREGFQDLGILNRGTALQQWAAEYKDHVVLSSAQFARPVTLEPGESWVGETALRWHDKFWELPLFERGPQPGGFSGQIMPGYEQLDREREMPPLPRQLQPRKTSAA